MALVTVTNLSRRAQSISR